ncbi:hypothetical protein [Synechocystis sp. PCC 7509]|uniref:hypothetical protein n=1 Tax=Synechocystis sp. PCC 7509 TaxID=927677 RepID=UPI0002AC9CC5|nr:hypothetical protein [Synechocystis sp. PCC 7509]
MSSASGAEKLKAIYSAQAEKEMEKLRLLDAKRESKRQSERDKTKNATKGLIPNNKRTHNNLQFADIFKSE